jgi:hypothetical protein
MFVTLSTYFYVGARMLNYSRKDVVYTNADERRYDKYHIVNIYILALDGNRSDHLTF